MQINKPPSATQIAQQDNSGTTNGDVSSRRNLLSTVSGLILLEPLLPQRWVKPMISSVMLPAHAQTSPLALSVENSTPACGTTVSLNAPLAVDFVLVPTPGVNQTIDFEVTCNGAPAISGNFNETSNAEGRVTFSGATGAGEGCVAGNELQINARFGTATASCRWTMN